MEVRLISFLLLSLSLCASSQVKQLDESEDLQEVPIGSSVTHFTVMKVGNVGVYLIGEDHSLEEVSREQDKANATKLCELLYEADEELREKKAYHVLVEQVINPFDYRRYSKKRPPESINRDLIYLGVSGAFINTKVENVELRTVSRAASMIIRHYIKGELDNLEVESWDATMEENFDIAFRCDIRTITFRDIVKSFDRISAKIKQYRDTWRDPAIRKMFYDVLMAVSVSFIDLCNFINSGGAKYRVENEEKIFDPDESILSFCQRDKERKFVHVFADMPDKLTNGFRCFVDIYVIHRILLWSQEENSVEKVIFYGGAGHVTGMRKLLCDYGIGECISRLAYDECFTPAHLERIRESLDDECFPPAHFERIKESPDEINERIGSQGFITHLYFLYEISGLIICRIYDIFRSRI